jgi:shikimate dehydrogenase
MRDGAKRSEEVLVFGLLGNPVGHSLSPKMHRAAFQAMGIEAEYVAFPVVNLEQAVTGIRGLGIRGASVTIPFKEEIISLIDKVDRVASVIGAVNTLVNDQGVLTGTNTDWLGLKRALESRISIRGRRVAILGAGGAARAAVYGVMAGGGEPILLNRTPQRAMRAARDLGCGWALWEGLGDLNAHVLVNATPAGMSPRGDECPVEPELLSRFHLVVDMVYNPLRTRLLEEAEARGVGTMNGVEMLVQQGAEQIRIWTGMEPPIQIMRKAVIEALGGEDED